MVPTSLAPGPREHAENCGPVGMLSTHTPCWAAQGMRGSEPAAACLHPPCSALHTGCRSPTAPPPVPPLGQPGDGGIPARSLAPRAGQRGLGCARREGRAGERAGERAGASALSVPGSRGSRPRSRPALTR